MSECKGPKSVRYLPTSSINLIQSITTIYSNIFNIRSTQSNTNYKQVIPDTI